MQKILVKYAVIILLIHGLCYSQPKKKIAPFQFDSIVAVEYNSAKYFLKNGEYGMYMGEPFVILSNGKYHPTVTKKVALSRQDGNDLVKTLLLPKTYDKRFKAACFTPRMGFVFELV